MKPYAVLSRLVKRLKNINADLVQGPYNHIPRNVLIVSIVEMMGINTAFIRAKRISNEHYPHCIYCPAYNLPTIGGSTSKLVKQQWPTLSSESLIFTPATAPHMTRFDDAFTSAVGG